MGWGAVRLVNFLNFRKFVVKSSVLCDIIIKEVRLGRNTTPKLYDF